MFNATTNSIKTTNKDLKEAFSPFIISYMEKEQTIINALRKVGLEADSVTFSSSLTGHASIRFLSFPSLAKPIVYPIYYSSIRGNRGYCFYKGSFEEDIPNLLYISPFVSRDFGSFLKERKINYLDFSGNCYFGGGEGPMLLVRSSDHDENNNRGEVSSFNAKYETSFRILRSLCSAYPKPLKMRELASLSKASLGQVSTVSTFLKKQLFIETSDNGICLINLKEFFSTWSKEYLKTRKDFEEYKFFTLCSEKEIVKTLKSYGMDAYALRSFSSAKEINLGVINPNIYLYVSRDILEKIKNDDSFKDGDYAANVFVIVPPLDSFFDTNVTHESSLPRTDDVQTMLDLYGEEGRGEEAADKIMEKWLDGKKTD